MNFFAGLKEKIVSTGFFNSPFYLKYHQFMVPGIVLVAAILITGLVTVPQFLNLLQTFKKIDELNTKKAFYQAKISTLEGINIDLYKTNLDTALIALPVDKDIPGVTGELLSALGASGLSLDGIAFAGNPTDTGKISELTLKVDVSGSQSNLANFLERIKQTPRIIKLTTIDIGNSKQRVTASIGLATLYQPLPESIGSVDESVPQMSASDNQTLADIEQKVKSIPQVAPEAATGGTRGKLDPFSL